jgi:Tol biopolymer transport system component
MAATARCPAGLHTKGGILAIALISLASCGGGGGGPGGSGGVSGNRHLRTIAFPGGVWASSPRFSPDGAQLAYARNTGTNMLTPTVTELAVMTAAGADSRSLTSDGDDLLCMVWTADGSELLYGSKDTGMRLAQLSGGRSQFLFDTPDALDPDLSPDGRWLVYGLYDGHLQLVDLSQSPLVPSDLGFSANSPRFSPDGATLALVTASKIRLFDLASQTFTDVIDTNNPLGRVDWFPDGTRLLAGTERGIEIITLGPPAQRQTIGGASGSSTATRDVDLSPDATSVAYTREGDPEVFVLTGF